MRKVLKCWVTVVAIAAAQAAVWGADGTWTNQTDGAWSGAANWQDGAVASGAGSVATLSDLAGPIRITNDVTGLKLKGLVARGGAYTLAGLPLTLEGTASGSYGLIASNGTLAVGSTVALNANSQVYAANGASLATTGLLDYLGNNTLTKAGAGEWLFSGTCAETNASAYFDISGGTLRLTSGAAFTLRGGARLNFRVGAGVSQPGRVVVEPGAALNLAAFVMGHDTGANGTIFLNGGTLTADCTDDNQAAQLGRWGDSTLSLSNNAVASFTRLLNVGCWARGTVNIGSGSQLTAGRLALGWQMDVNTTMTGPAVINIGDGGALTVGSALIWHASGPASRTNYVTVSGGPAGSGRLAVPASGFRDTNQASFTRLTVNGGRLELLGLRDTAYGQSLTNYFYGLNQLWIGQAGATVDTSNNTVVVMQKLEHDTSAPTDGGLTKRGSGSLTLAGGCSYAGDTVVEAGTLRLQGVLPTNGVTVLPGAALSLVDGQFRAFAPQRLTAGLEGGSTVELEVGAGNACDSMALSSRAQLGNVSFRLVGLGGTSSYWFAGDYVVATYAGGAPNVSGWQASSPAGVSVSFEVQSAQKRVVMHVTGAATGSSVWIAPGGGAWATAANWNTAPVNDPATAVRFGNAVEAAAQVTLGAPVTLGSLTLDTPFACSLGGAGMTFGAAAASGSLAVQQGSHAIASALTVPTNLAVTVQPGAALLVGGGVTGAGRVTVTGGGTLSLSNGAAFNVPLTVDGGVLGLPQSTTFGSALEIGAGGATLAPATGKTVTFSGSVGGSGALAKTGASIAVMSGENSGTGTRTVRNGTLTLSSLTDGGDLVLGEGTLKYTGPTVTTAKGLTIRTTDAKLGATFSTDADVTFNGNIKSENGVFVKAGKGTVTFAAPGNNQFGFGIGSDNYSVLMNFGPYGESPTQGLRSFQVVEGKVILGAEGQTNVFPQTIIVGGETTTTASAEKAATLEINGGVTRFASGTLTIGRGNGTAVTAPTGLVSTVRLNSGALQLVQLWMGARLNDMPTITARPLFEMNGGTLTSLQLFCGNDGTSRPRLVFNGGFAAFAGATAGDVRLAYGASVTGEVVVAGGTLAVSNSLIRMAENAAGAKGIVRLNSGRLITRGFERLGSGAGDLFLNGGVLQPCVSATLSNLSAAVVQAGGFRADVPEGLTLAVAQALEHDAALGVTPDGGVIKFGAGTLALAGTSTYTGPTIVSGGVLRVTGTLAVTNLTLAGGATLSLTNGLHQTFGPSALAAGDVGGNARIELDVAADGSAYDVLALPDGAGVKLTLALYRTGTAVRFTRPGRYPLVTFAGGSPDTSSWTVEGLAGTTVFETAGSVVYVRIGASSETVSVWTNTVGGAWSDAANWSVAPANTAADTLLFGSAIAAPATVTTGDGVTFGYLSADSANAYTWSGGAMTLGAADSNATVHVAQGAHVADLAWAVPTQAVVQVDAGASLTVNGAVTGAGRLAVTGGGTVSLTNGPAVDVPVTVDGATLTMPLSTEYDTSFTLGAGGATFAPASARTVTVSSSIAGAGGLTKTGSSLLTLSGGTSFGGELVVRNGTVSMAAEPGGPLVISEGTFKYTGAGAAFTRGYTVRTTANTQPATLDSDADITFNGPVNAESGAFIKLGSGTLTYAYAGPNTLSAGDNPGTSRLLLNRQPYGDAPTQGYRSFNIYNGKVAVGAAGQTNRFAGAIVIGGESTTNADAETAAQMEINGGVNISDDAVIIGRGNGSATTAPTGLVSSLTINGGESLFPTVRLADKLDDMATLTARPLLTLNNGVLSTKSFYCGNSGGTPRPRIVINGGLLTVGPDSDMNLANAEGCVTEMDLNGGTVVLTNQDLRLAANQAGAQGTLNLNGGRLIANNIYQEGVAGVGVVNFNGGVFQPSATRTMSGLTAATNRLGGAIFDVPEGITLTLAQPLLHDEGLGGTPDGGLVKVGAGTLVLAATNTYTGPTMLSNGTLKAVAPVGSALAAGELSLGSAAGPEVALNLTADQARFLSGGAVTVYGNLFLGKTAVTLLMRETGTAPSTNGVYTVATCAGTISGSASDLRVANPVFGRGYTFSVSGSEVLLTVGTDSVSASIWTNAGSGDWSASGNWSSAPGAGSAGKRIGFLDAITGPAAVTLDAPATAGYLCFNSANSYAIAGEGSLTLDETNGVPVVTAEQGVHTVSVPVGLADNVTVSASAAADEVRLTGAVTGDGKLTKEGDGRLLLSGTNTYAGGTEVKKGAIDAVGAGVLGTGPVVFNGGHLAAKGAETAVVPNDVSALLPVYIGTYAPLLLTGDWTATGDISYYKIYTNELTVSGMMRPSAGAKSRIEIRDGSVRFAAGADALFTNASVRNTIDFSNASSGSAVRRLTVEAGAQVAAGCLYEGYGATNTVSVAGGALTLLGAGADKDALLVGTGASSVSCFEVSGGAVTAADDTWSLFGVDAGLSFSTVSGGSLSLGKLAFGVRDSTVNNTGAATLETALTVAGGLLEARQRWNWLGDLNGQRLNAVYLNGGRLRLPATFASTAASNRLSQSRLVFNGGVLETPGNGADPENPTNYLNGLKQAYVGAGGAVVDTQGRSVTLAQRLTALGGAADGGVVKRGFGTLALAKPPCVTGRIDVQSGTLQLQPEAGTAYPDDPMLRVSFENGIQKDDSPYGRAIGLVGSLSNLSLTNGVNGTNALHMGGQNVLYADYSADMANADSFTVSAWVRQSAYQAVTQNRTFFGTLIGSQKPQEFLLRVQDGHFRMLGTGAANYGYGTFYADVTNAVPLNTWVMLTYVVDGQNGFSMYVNGQRRTMRVMLNSVETYTLGYGAGSTWLLQPPARTSGRGLMIGTVNQSDANGFIGDLDDVTVYRRALSAPEVALLYQAKVPYDKRVRVAAGAGLNLSGATQELADVTGEGQIGNGTAGVKRTLNPGDEPASAAGALLSAANLTLGTNMTYRCDWAPDANDLVDVYGTLAVSGAGTVDLGLTVPGQMPGYPRHKSFPVMYYTTIVGAANFGQWKVTGIGRTANASVSAANGVVTVNLEVFSGTLMLLR